MKFEFVIFPVILKIELYPSNLVNPTIQEPSRPRLIDGSNGKISLGWVILISNVSCESLLVCLLSVSQFIAIEKNKS